MSHRKRMTIRFKHFKRAARQAHTEQRAVRSGNEEMDKLTLFHRRENKHQDCQTHHCGLIRKRHCKIEQTW